MKKNIQAKIEEGSPVWKATSSVMTNKQRSVLEENEEFNSKNQAFILLLKEKQELKEKIMKNEKKI